MRRTIPTARIAAAALVAATAACSDSPVAPSSASTEAPSAAVARPAARGPVQQYITGTLFVTSPDYPAGAIAMVRFSNSSGWSMEVHDGWSADGDPRMGYIQVQMPVAASYTATLLSGHPSVAADGASKTVTPLIQPATLSFGTLAFKKKPRLTVHVFDQALGGPRLGQTVRARNLSTGAAEIGTDGQVDDADFFEVAAQNDGKVQLWLPAPGSYEVCALSVPAGYAARCRVVSAPAWNTDQSTTVHYTLAPK